jgi:hypothetical protein
MKNLSSYLFIGSLLGSLLYADLDDRLDTLEKEMHQVAIYTSKQTMGASFGASHPELLVRGEHLRLFLEPLYWQIKVNGLDFAYSFQPTLADQGNKILPPVKGSVKTQSFDWSWGLKFGLGHQHPHDDWDLNLLYTWYSSDSTTRANKDPPSALMPLCLFTKMIASEAKSQLTLDYYNLDLIFGKSYFITKMIDFHPFMGIQGSILDLRQNLIYKASSLNDSLFPNFQTNHLDFKSKNRSHFWAVGPTIGVKTRWFLDHGFSLFNDLKGSLLYARFKTVYDEQVPPNGATSSSGTIAHLRHRFHRSIPTCEIFTGLGWQGYFKEKKQYLSLKLGYEALYSWEAAQLFEIEDFSSGATLSTRFYYNKLGEDIQLYGLRLQVQLDF